MPKTYDGQHCPYDGEVLTTTGGIEASDMTTAYRNMKCDKCNRRFVEAFVISGLDEFDNEGGLVNTFEMATE